MPWNGAIGSMRHSKGEVHIWDDSGHSIHFGPEGRYCISEDQVWRPGCFETQAAAELAFDLTDEEIEELKAAKPRGSSITTAQVRAKIGSR